MVLTLVGGVVLRLRVVVQVVGGVVVVRLRRAVVGGVRAVGRAGREAARVAAVVTPTVRAAVGARYDTHTCVTKQTCVPQKPE